MIKEKVNYHVLFKKIMTLKLVLIIILFMFINTLDMRGAKEANYGLGANWYGSADISDKVGKIYKVMNLPVEVVNNMFRKNMSYGSSGEEEEGDEGASYALLVPMKKSTKKAGEISAYAALAYNNYLAKLGGILSSVITADVGILEKYSDSNGMVKYGLLFLIIFAVLPRGIPENKKNKNNNIGNAYPVF
jgi:hypothetical protein